MEKNENLSLTGEPPYGLSTIQKLALSAASIGVLILLLAFFNLLEGAILLGISIFLLLGGSLVYGIDLYLSRPEGIKNNAIWFDSLSNRGVIGWFFGIILTGFYVLLYWFPHFLGLSINGESNSGLIAFFSPLSNFIKGQDASQWFVYGTLYTLAIIALGVKFILKYRHNRYQRIRTIVVMAAQLILAYFLPEVLEGLNSGTPYFGKDLKQIWPLNYYIVEDWYLDAMTVPQKAGPSGLFYFLWALILFLVVTPVLTYLVGKRWYCSWICGCGGLAETAGDNFRHLSSKKLSSWKLERWLVHSIMVFVLLMSVAVFYTYFTGREFDLKLFSIDQTTFVWSATVFLSSALMLSLFAYFNWSNRNKYVLAGSAILIMLIGALLFAYVKGSSELFLFYDKPVNTWYGWPFVIVLKGLLILSGLIYFRFTQRSKYALAAMVFIGFLIACSYIAIFTGTTEIYLIKSKTLKAWYGFLIGAMFSGVIGVGFYPILGNRVWCRFGCPLAGYMGIIQRFKSRFRITTNGGQCISCGNCSTYCEQGIDVRAYAQKGENIVRASCVGCGICAAVCPRGVLRLENGPEEGRIVENPIMIGSEGVTLRD